MFEAIKDRWLALREATATPPIIILSFNRPHYLRQVLKSLAGQVPKIDGHRAHLFQDGAVNAYSGNVYAEQRDINKCMRMFRRRFPDGTVHASDRNIGIAENFLRAERFAFETLEAPVAYFFEDDLVLSKHYVAALDTLRRHFAGRKDVGYFNACGRHTAPIEEQRRRSADIIEMGHSWGFGLRRSHWLAMQPILAPYYELVCGADYRARPGVEIRALWNAAGFEGNPATSQDWAKKAATELLAAQRLSCFPALGTYIGVVGTHFNEDTFRRYRFDETVTYRRPLRRLNRLAYLKSPG